MLLPLQGLLSLFLPLNLVLSIPTQQQKDTTRTAPKITSSAYPLPNIGHVRAHDPNILYQNNSYYLFKGGISIPIFKADSLSGPWTRAGTVLDGPSSVQKQNPKRPWAPMVSEYQGKVYCFYSISQNGMQDSAIGVAESRTGSIDGGGGWIDHGALINTGNGRGSRQWPYNVSNAIDPAFFVDPVDQTPYLSFGSYWRGIFQLPLTSDLSVEGVSRGDVDHLVGAGAGSGQEKKKQNGTGKGKGKGKGKQQQNPVEGSFVSYHAPWYYTWFSHGKCCQFTQTGFPKKGDEYSIRVGRSDNVHGPFFDRDNTSLLNGGGSVVYGSNHGSVYAPGGLGVLSGVDGGRDVLYYHYLNTTVGYGQGDAMLGWNHLEYVDGWPVPQPPESRAPTLIPSLSTLHILVLLCICMCCLPVLFVSVLCRRGPGGLGRKSMIVIPLVFMLVLWLWF